MKRMLGILFFISSLLSIHCRKKADEFGLPPATQEGKNTLGFLVNGNVWTPEGRAGTPNLEINFSNGGGKGAFSLTADRILSSANSEFIGLGMIDSLLFYSPPFTIQLTRTSLFRVYFKPEKCSYFSTDNDTEVSGSLTITRFDKINRIFAGVFNVSFSKYGCENIIITEGRFDIKF